MPEWDEGPRPRVNLRKTPSAGQRVNLSKTSARLPVPPEVPVSPLELTKATRPAPSDVRTQFPTAAQPPQYSMTHPVLPPPPSYSAPPPAAPTGPSKVLIAVLAAVAALALLGTVYLLTGSDDDAPTATSGSGRAVDTSAAEPCASPPDITVRSLTESAAGLTAEVAMTASCRTGDVIADPRFGVTIADGGRDVAAGTFDLLSDPVRIPPGGTAERQLVFPTGMYWRIPELVNATPEATAAPSGAGTATGTAGRADGSSTVTAVQPLAPRYASAEDAALSALRDLAASDRSSVAGSLENLWVPQISSKRPGLFAEGIDWAPADILREHLALRGRYGNVKLVWSGDWSTFNGSDWWVTVVGDPTGNPESALGWCVGNGLDRDHCFAKMISTTRGTEGTTVMQK